MTSTNYDELLKQYDILFRENVRLRLAEDWALNIETTGMSIDDFRTELNRRIHVGDCVSWEAGHEMDALVAEKVMGWTPDTTGGRGWPNGDFYPPNDIHGVQRILGTKVDDVEWIRWEPSSDISAAWEVVEKITHPIMLNRGKEGWRMVITPVDTPHAVAYPQAIAPTAPLAICRAALMATGSTRVAGENATPEEGEKEQ